MKKRLLAILLALTLVVSLMPVGALADDSVSDNYVKVDVETGSDKNTLNVNVYGPNGALLETVTSTNARTSDCDINITLINDEYLIEDVTHSGDGAALGAIASDRMSYESKWSGSVGGGHTFALNVYLRANPTESPKIPNGTYNGPFTVGFRAYESQLLKMLYCENPTLVNDNTKITGVEMFFRKTFGEGQSVNFTPSDRENDYFYFELSNASGLAVPANVSEIRISYKNGETKGVASIEAGDLSFVYNGGAGHYYSIESSNDNVHIVYFYNEPGTSLINDYHQYAVRFVEDGGNLQGKMPKDPEYPQSSHFEFVAWTYDYNAGRPFLETTTVNEDITVYAQKQTTTSNNTWIYVMNDSELLKDRIEELYGREDINWDSVKISVYGEGNAHTNPNYNLGEDNGNGWRSNYGYYFVFNYLTGVDEQKNESIPINDITKIVINAEDTNHNNLGDVTIDKGIYDGQFWVSTGDSSQRHKAYIYINDNSVQNPDQPDPPEPGDMNGTDLKIAVYVDGTKVDDPLTYINVERVNSTLGWEVTVDRYGYIICDFAYETYDCADVKITLQDTNKYVQGILYDQSYGEAGAASVDDQGNGVYVIDNMCYGPASYAVIYIDTKYSVEYYLDNDVYKTENDGKVYVINRVISKTDDGVKDSDVARKTVSWRNPYCNYYISSKFDLPAVPVNADGWYAYNTGKAITGKVYLKDVLPTDDSTTIEFYANTKDELGGGDDGREPDGTPDYKQVFVEYVSADTNMGTVAPTKLQAYNVEVDENGYVTSSLTINLTGVATPNKGYAFVNWTIDGQIFAETDSLSGFYLKFPVAGKIYTYTANFAVDKIGGGNDGDEPDGTPDYKQVVIRYVSADENMGTVKPEFKVVTFGVDANGNVVVEDVELSGVATPNEGYAFVNWTGEQFLAETASLSGFYLKFPVAGKIYTYTANFEEAAPDPITNEDLAGVTVVLDCIDNVGHEDGSYTLTLEMLKDGRVNVGPITANEDGTYSCTVAVHAAKFLTKYSSEYGLHWLVEGQENPQTVEMTWTRGEGWSAEPVRLTFQVTSKPDAPTPVVPPVDDDDDEVYVPNWLNTTDHYAYIVGYEDGMIKPGNNITRAEVATIFFRLLTDNARERFWSTTNEFSDVNAGSWYNNAISTLSNMGIITGYDDGTFKPNAQITRAEFVTIATRFFSYKADYDGAFKDVSYLSWYADYVQAAVDMGLVSGYPDGSFRPGNNITRAEAVTIVNRVLHRVPHEDHLLALSTMNVWPDNPYGTWYYADMQEATNSHSYKWIRVSGALVEDWTGKLAERDWAALESEWANAHSK